MNKNLSYKNSAENLAMILALHAIFFLSAFLLVKNLELIFCLPLFVVLSLIHHKFLGEFIHEGAHYHLYRDKNINEFLSNYLVGIFFFISVGNYRKTHFKHHEYQLFFDPEDPETGPLKIRTKKEFWKNIILDLTGSNGLLFYLFSY